MRHIVIVSGLGLWLGLLQAAKSSPYFGQPVPGMTPALFAPGIVSPDGVELNTVFTPDLKEMFFARAIDRVPSMFHSRLVDGAWTTPREPRTTEPALLLLGDDEVVERFALGVLARLRHSHASCRRPRS